MREDWWKGSAPPGEYVRKFGPGPGRPKGSKDKYTRLKETFLLVVEDLGGREWIKAQAEKEPMLFLKMVASLLPKEVNNNVSGDLTLEVITGIDRAPNDCDGVPAEEAPEAHP